MTPSRYQKVTPVSAPGAHRFDTVCPMQRFHWLRFELLTELDTHHEGLMRINQCNCCHHLEK